MVRLPGRFEFGLMFCGPDLAFESKYFLEKSYSPLLGAKLLTSYKRYWREIAAHGPLPAIIGICS
jgi:hypothetical protein